MNRINEKAQELQANLEDLLVREFRACQGLSAYTKEERAALTSNNVEKLSELVDKKEALLDEIGMVEESRRSVVESLAREIGQAGKCSTLTELLPHLESAIAGRLSRLREGILALSSEVRDLTSGNVALTNSALEHNDALQSFLLAICQPPPIYQSTGTAASLAPTPWNLNCGA